MAASTDLTTLSAVKEALDIEGDDDYLENLIGRVSEVIERYCDREFAAQDITEIFDGTGTKEYALQQFPVNSIDSFYYRSGNFSDDSWAEISDSYYTYKEHSGLMYYSGKFDEGVGNFKVIYNAGYETIPNDIDQAAIQLISHYYNKRKGSDVESESIGDYSVKYKSVEDTIQELGIDLILDTYVNHKA